MRNVEGAEFTKGKGVRSWLMASAARKQHFATSYCFEHGSCLGRLAALFRANGRPFVKITSQTTRAKYRIS